MNLPNRVQKDDVHINATFNQATTRTNLKSGENICTSFGKIQKYFNDLGDSAFTDVDTSFSSSSNNPVANSTLSELFTPMTQSDYDSLTDKTMPLYFIVET